MKNKIEINEAYPVYSIFASEQGIDIPENKVKWIIEVNKEYDKVQLYLQILSDKEFEKIEEEKLQADLQELHEAKINEQKDADNIKKSNQERRNR